MDWREVLLRVDGKQKRTGSRGERGKKRLENLLGGE